MDSILRWGTLSIEGWPSFWEALHIPEPAWAWVEDEAAWQLTPAAEITLIPGARGRLFAPQGELRWRKVGLEDFRLVFLGSELWTSLDRLTDASDELQGLQVRPFTHRLWGEWTSGFSAWIEQRIPHHLKYPTKGRFIELRGYTLHDPVTNQVLFQRYCELGPWSEEGSDAAV